MARRVRLTIKSDDHKAAPVATMRLHPAMPRTVHQALATRRVQVLATTGGWITDVLITNEPHPTALA
jgi:hypothetical protein